MSNPFQPTDWDRKYGFESDLYAQELAGFHTAQNQRLSLVLNSLGAPAYQNSPVQQAATPPATTQWHDEDLVGAATFWGIPEEVARAMPRQQLIDVVNQKRTMSRGEGVSMIADMAGPLAMFGVGAGEAVTGGLQKLPLVGDWFAKQKLVHDSDLYMRQLEEGVRASTDIGEQGILSAANIAGNVAALWYPTNTVFKLAEGIGGAIPLVGRSAIARAAFAGGASAYALEGGSQEFKDNPGASLAFAGALGAGFRAIEPLVQQAATRVARKFVPGFGDPGRPQGPWPSGGYQDIQPDLGPRQLSAPAQQLALPPGFPPEASPAIPMGRGSAPFEGMPIPQFKLLNAGEPGLGGDFAYLAPFNKNAGGDLAAQLNKTATILESPALADISGHTEIGEATVAHAAMASNPGGTNVVQGISDPASLLQQFGGNVRFAQRGERMDALLGNISDKQLAQYEEHGIYEGQHVLTPEGNQVVVDGIHQFGPSLSDLDRTVASVKHPQGITSMFGEPLWPTHMLTPLTSSPEAQPIPGMWELFNQYADARAAETHSLIGASMAPEHTFATRQQNLGQYLNEFLDRAAVNDPAERARLLEYMNERYVQSWADVVDPEMKDWHSKVLEFKANTPVTTTPLAELDQLAAVKGFDVIPDGRTGKIRLLDNVHEGEAPDPPIVTMNSLAEAKQFVTSLNRDLPDITPASDVPIEVAGSIPTEARQAGADLVNDEHVVEAMAATESSNQLHSSGQPEGLSLPGGVGGEGLAGGAVPGPETAQVATLLRNGKLIEAMQQVTTGFAKWRPFSTLVGQWDQVLKQFGHDTGIAMDYAKALYAHDLNVTWKAPWQREMGAILSQARRSVRDNGAWTRVWMMQEPGDRLAAALNERLTKAELASMDAADEVLDRLYGTTGAGRELADYAAYVGERQSTGAADAWEGYNHTSTGSFGDVYGKSQVNLREISPDLLFAHAIGAKGWSMHMDEVYTQLSGKWQAISNQLPDVGPVSDLFGNWLKSMRYGYQPMDSTALSAGHAILQGLMGPEVTEQQARQFFGGGLSLTQQSLLGFKPHVIVRDGLRFAFALPKQGMDLIHTIGAFLKGSKADQEAMWRFAMDRGIVTQQASSIHPPGYFEAPPSPAGGPQAMLAGAEGSLRHRIAQTMYYTVADNLPAWMRDPTPGRLSPLYWVSKQAEMMRMLVGNAQYIKTNRALEAFRAAGPAGNPAQLLGESAMRTLPKAYQDTFMQYVASGDNEAAATFAARIMVDQTMFRYGHLEAPLVAKNISGRIALQLGNFGLHTYQYVKTGLREGTAADKLKMLTALGGTSAALIAAQNATGWKFSRMSPLHGMGFTGGPWLEPVVDGLKDLGGAFQWAQGTDTPTNRQGFDALTRLPATLGALVNPAAGLVRGMEAIGSAAQSPEPGMAALRYISTGEINNQPDIQHSMAAQTDAAFKASLHMMSNPVRANSYGTEQIPYQMPVYAPLIQSPQTQIQNFERDPHPPEQY